MFGGHHGVGSEAETQRELRFVRRAMWVSVAATVACLAGAALTEGAAATLGLCIAAAAFAGASGGLANRRTLVAGGFPRAREGVSRRTSSLMRTVLLLGALCYLVLLPVISFGEAALRDLTYDGSLRRLFITTTALVLALAFAIASRPRAAGAHHRA